MKMTASLILLTYNQEQYVYDALVSVLNQDYEELEIVISDDCSTDATWEVVTKTIQSYTGNKKIILNKNFENLGIIGNLNEAFKCSTGALIFTAAGDDISLHNRCSECVKFYLDQKRSCDLIGTDVYDMLEDGSILDIKKIDKLEEWNIDKWFNKRPIFYGASHMMTRSLLLANPLNPKLSGEDQCLVFRALLMSGAVRLDKPLVLHRRGGISQKQEHGEKTYKYQELAKSCQRSLIEADQMLGDAKIMGFFAKVLPHIQQVQQTSSYGYQILTSADTVEKLSLFLKTQNISFAKRFRFGMYAIFSDIIQAFVTVKSRLRGK